MVGRSVPGMARHYRGVAASDGRACGAGHGPALPLPEIATHWLWTYSKERSSMALGGITPMQTLALAACSTLVAADVATAFAEKIAST